MFIYKRKHISLPHLDGGVNLATHFVFELKKVHIKDPTLVDIKKSTNTI